jgi:TolB-like protein/Tfp pilus assembly protein PilF
MKQCPECGREYDLSMSFCLDDGAELLYGPTSRNDHPTAILSASNAEAATSSGSSTRAQLHTTDQTAVFPGGVVTEPPVTAGNLSQRKGGPARPLIVVVVATILLVGGYFGYKYFSPTRQIESIAVLPFVNESGNAEVEYLSDGMTETLISSLTQLPNLNVKARSSVFRYKRKDTDIKTIGNELNVQTVLTGRVAQRGDQLSLSLELVDVATENAIWSRQYNRKQSDLVSLQSEIARDVSGKLRSKLSGVEVAKIEKNYTADPEAYQLYLKGKFYWNNRTGAALKQAADFYEQAIAKDPNYALAYSGLAETYVLFSSYGVASAPDSMPQAKAAAMRALEIDEQLAEAHTALGFYLSNYEWDREGSEKEYRRAIELRPNYSTAHHWLGADLGNVRRFDEGIAELKRAEELDPLSSIIGTNLGDNLRLARRYDDAIAQYKRVIGRSPKFSYAHLALARAYGLKGMYPEALAEMQKTLELDPDTSDRGWMGFLMARAGRRDDALRILIELKEGASRKYIPNDGIAVIYLALGNKQDALDYLEKHMAERAETASIYAVDPDLDELRAEPRFKAMLKRMNLPE